MVHCWSWCSIYFVKILWAVRLVCAFPECISLAFNKSMLSNWESYSYFPFTPPDFFLTAQLFTPYQVWHHIEWDVWCVTALKYKVLIITALRTEVAPKCCTQCLWTRGMWTPVESVLLQENSEESSWHFPLDSGLSVSEARLPSQPLPHYIMEWMDNGNTQALLYGATPPLGKELWASAGFIDSSLNATFSVPTADPEMHGKLSSLQLCPSWECWRPLQTSDCSQNNTSHPRWPPAILTDTAQCISPKADPEPLHAGTSPAVTGLTHDVTPPAELLMGLGQQLPPRES